jgi:hypothetical protein
MMFVVEVDVFYRKVPIMPLLLAMARMGTTGRPRRTTHLEGNRAKIERR